MYANMAYTYTLHYRASVSTLRPDRVAHIAHIQNPSRFRNRYPEVLERNSTTVCGMHVAITTCIGSLPCRSRRSGARPFADLPYQGCGCNTKSLKTKPQKSR